MPTFSRRRLAKTAVRLLYGQPGKRQVVVRSIAAYLAATKRTKQLGPLMKDIARELAAHNEASFAEVYSAFALDDERRQWIVNYLKRETGASSVELDEHIDPELLSGIVIRTADQEVDLSARGQLKKLMAITSAQSVSSRSQLTPEGEKL